MSKVAAEDATYRAYLDGYLDERGLADVESLVTSEPVEVRLARALGVQGRIRKEAVLSRDALREKITALGDGQS